MNQQELVLVGAALFNANKALEIPIGPEHFSTKIGAAIWQTVTAMASSGDSVDMVSVIGALGDKYRKVVGQAAQEAGAAENMATYAKQVRQAWIRRQCFEKWEELDWHQPGMAVNDMLTFLLDMDRPDTSRVVSAGQMMSEVTEYVDRVHQLANAGQTVGVPTGITDLDTMIGGWQDSDLNIVAARPAMGKTAFMLSSIIAAARKGYKTCAVSAEMPTVQLGVRALAGASGVSGIKLRNGRVTSDDFARLPGPMGELAKLDFEIMDASACTPAEIVKQAQVWCRQGMKALWIDHLHRLRPDRRYDNLSQQVGDMAQTFKETAKRLEIPVILLAQLNRECEKRDDKRPVMSDLRESGGIEQEADMVAFLYRDSVYHDTGRPEAAEIIIEKQRNGPIGTLECAYLERRMMWADQDIARYDDAG